MVFYQEIGEIFSPDPEMPTGESEGRKLAAAYPAQHGSIADAAFPGDKSYGNVVWSLLYRSIFQGCLLQRLLRIICVVGLIFALVLFVVFGVYVTAVTGKSQSQEKTSQNNHRKMEGSF
jgi:hypothetical protein